MGIDPTILTQSRWLAYGLVFVGGIVTSIGPCNLATIPILVSYVAGTTTPTRGRAFALSLGFAVGLATTFMLLIVDGDGQELWREWGVASNPEVFDLGEVEARIAALGWGDS